MKRDLRKYENIRIYELILIIVLATITLLRPVAAAEEDRPAQTKSVEESVNELFSIRDDASLSEEQKSLKEIEIRKEILVEVLSLSLNEVAKLTAKINNLPEFAEDSREKTGQDEFRKALEEYNAYYAEQKKKLKGLITINEIKKLAQEIKEYRDNVYNSKVQNIVTFVLVFYNEDVLKIATARFDKISADVKKLEKLGYLKIGAFSAELAKTKEILNTASALKREAKSAVLTPPEELKQPSAANSEDTKMEPPPEPHMLIKESLNGVKSAYNIFIQIGKDLRKLLGIE